MGHRPLNFIAKSISSGKSPLFVFLIFMVIAGVGLIIASKNKECPIRAEERLVRGDSLSPFINSGQTVKVLFDYYNCHEIEREDVVVYRHGRDKDPFIKIVKGISGDKFSLVPVPNSSDWRILINGEVVINSQGQPYSIDGKGYQMLSLYEKDYKGYIPKNAYLLLGNGATNSIDSTRSGLIDKSSILGKVEK